LPSSEQAIKKRDPDVLCFVAETLCPFVREVPKQAPVHVARNCVMRTTPVNRSAVSMRKHAMVSLVLAFGVVTAGCAAPLELVRDGGTLFVIYHEADVPSSVAMAAADLQDYLSKATGAKLAIANEPGEPMICLGDNPASRAEGLYVADIPLEGFRIVTRGRNLYILGPDTGDGERTPGGGTSTGTRNGVYTFLEKFVGIRWLMPGEHGDYVPRSPDLTIPDTDLSDAPFFLNRRLPTIQNRRPEVKLWSQRQRLGLSLYLWHGHSWYRWVPAGYFEEHPDFFAMNVGVRTPPVAHHKLCITNPELIRLFADRMIASFDRSPEVYTLSISPSDGRGWCECPNCRALYEEDPNGELSVSPAILTFYNAVARLVAQKYPDKLLAGYVYSDYIYPPKEPIELAPNVFLVWAMSDAYGYKLFRPEVQADWERILAGWMQVTDRLAYYDLPVIFEQEAGAPNPVALSILKFIYPRLKAAGIKGVYVYGCPAWGHGAPVNYLLARLAWDPEADVEALFDESCDKAYAEGGADINQMYRMLDAAMERHYRTVGGGYTLTLPIIENVYAANFEEIERLYRSARRKARDEDARERLRMLGDNLKVFHWTLRNAGMLEEPERSVFYLSDAELLDFIDTHQDSLAVSRMKVYTPPREEIVPVSVEAVAELPGAEPPANFRLRGDQHMILYATGDGPIEVTFRNVEARGKLVTCHLFDAEGNQLERTLMSVEAPLVIQAAGGEHRHLVIMAGQASFRLRITGAAWALSDRMHTSGLHFLGQGTPAYFLVPEGTTSFSLALRAAAPGETAVAELYAPDGRLVANFDCTQTAVDFKAIPVGPGDAGFWKVSVERADVGYFDDAHVKQGKGLSGYFFLVPDQALVVTAAR